MQKQIFRDQKSQIDLTKKNSLKANLEVYSGYAFPGLLNFEFPANSQDCSYYETLKQQFQDGIVELESLQVALDSAPQAIEDTFSEMKDNFTEYNGRGGDQLNETIIEDTDKIIEAAPNILTLSQRQEYYNDLNATLAKIKDYYDNDACTFQVIIQDYNSNHICVSESGDLTSLGSTEVVDNCDNL